MAEVRRRPGRSGPRPPDGHDGEARVRDLLGRMTLEEKLAQLVGFWDKEDGEAVAPLQGEFGGADQPRRVRPARARPPHPPLRHPPGRPGRARAPGCGSSSAAWSPAPGSASRRSSTRSASPGSRPGRRPPIPTPLAWGAAFDPELVERDGRGDRRVDARARHPPGPRPGARRRPRPALGPGRGDHRRGPVPGRHDRHRVRARPAVGRACTPRSSTSPATPPRAPAATSRPVHAGPARARRRAAAAVRDGGPRRRRPLGDALLRRDRRRARSPPTRRCSPACCASGGASTARSSPTTSASPSCTCCTASRPTSARRPALALAAGIDVELPTGDAYGEPLARRGAGGRRSTRRWSTGRCGGCCARRWSSGCSTRRSTTSRRRTSTSTRPSTAALARAAGRGVGRAARQRRHACRCRAGARVAVVGPNADRPEALLRLLLVPQPRRSPSTPACGPASRCRPCSRRCAAEFRRRLGHRRAGCAVDDDDRSGFAEAVAAAAAADVAVARRRRPRRPVRPRHRRRGLRPRRPRAARRPARAGRGGAGDRARRWSSCCSPAGRTRSAGRWTRCAAVVQAFFPGEEGGRRVAGVLSGRVNPSGRLPVSLPRVGRRAAVHLPAPRAGRGRRGHQPPTTPAAPFGHGLSYTTFAHDRPRRCRPTCRPTGAVRRDGAGDEHRRRSPATTSCSSTVATWSAR